MYKLLIYTRKPIDNIYYDPRLAYSVHLAISKDGEPYRALNHNSGVYFARSTENEDGSINPKCLKNPRVIRSNNSYLIISRRTDGEGLQDPESSDSEVLIASTKDFISYDETGLAATNSDYEALLAATPSVSESLIDGIIGAVPEYEIEINDNIAKGLLTKLTTPVNTGVEVPAFIAVSEREELSNIRINATYSDGSVAKKSIDWDLDGIDFSVPGEHIITGRVHRPHFDFPVLFDRADPCIGRWNGKYYFISTNDADNNHTIYVRESNTLEGLLTAEDHLILDSSTYPDVGGLLWAPEFHIIKGNLYIFHACTPEPFFEEESHIMELRKGGNPCNKDDWSRPLRVVRADGSDICERGKVITLDMTEFEWNDDYYVIWSQRQFLPKDLGAWLMIARLNPDKPYMLASEPVVLSKPDYGWGNNHTFVEEGPFALKRGNTLFVTFSAAAVDTSYVVGLLTLKPNGDPLNPSDWIKKGYPILTSRSVDGEFGTGHNAYVTDADGVVWNTYHARPGTSGPRSSGIRRVHFGIDGEPILDMTETDDVSDEFINISTRLIINKRYR